MSYNTKVYRRQGGDELVVADGGKVAVESGGEIDFESGSELKINGVQVTASAAEINAAGDYVDELEVTPEQFNAGLALVGVMVGGQAEASHDDDTGEIAIEILAANESGGGNRALLLIIKCTETLAADGNLPIFEIGDGETAGAFITIGHGGDPATLAENAIIVASGVLIEERPLEITVTDGTIDNQAGAIQVFAVALPVSVS